MTDMSIKLVRYSVVLILCFCSLWSEARVTVFPPTDKKTTTDEFVTVRDGKFFIGQKEYRYVAENRKEAVFFWYKLECFKNEHFPVVKMRGLDPEKRYVVRELNRIDQTALPFEGKSFSGRYLMDRGLELPYEHDLEWSKKVDWASRVLYLSAE